MSDTGLAMELAETLLYLSEIDPADYGNLHDVKNPKAEALAVLDMIEAETPWYNKPRWFNGR